MASAALIPAQALNLRASAMPLAFRCAGSVRRAELPIAETSEPADLGSATHEALRPLAEGGGIAWDDLPEIAGRWGVELEDLRALCATAAKLWTEIAESFSGALTEVELRAEIAPGVELTGHADLLAVSGSVARAGDWKTGRKDHDYSQQMRAYGALILLDDETLTEVTVTILWTRTGEIENYTVTRESAARWVRELLAEVVSWDGTYRPGPHCGFCPRSHECPAANAMVRRDVQALIEDGDAFVAGLAALVPDVKLALYRRASLVASYAERVKKAIRADVEENGDIVTDDGRLTLVGESRRELKPLEAWPVLETAGLRDDDFAEVVDLPITRIEKLVAKKAGKGKGAAAVRALNEKLEAAGAITKTTIQKLQDLPKRSDP